MHAAKIRKGQAVGVDPGEVKRGRRLEASANLSSRKTGDREQDRLDSNRLELLVLKV